VRPLRAILEKGATHRVSIAMSVGLFVATLLLTRQTQVPELNGLGAPWALLLVFAYLHWRPAILSLAPMILYVLSSAVVSLMLGSDPASVLRFSVITCGTLLAFHIRPVPISVPWGLLPLAAQVALLIGISLWLTVSQSDELATAARGFALESGWGDIYSFDGIYYRVQVIGNALLPLLFLISLWRYTERRLYRFMTVFSLLGLLAAGNLTYELAAGIGLLMRTWRLILGSAIGRVITAVVLAVAIVFAGNEANELFDRKFDGSDSSMGIRFDQIHVAQEAWSRSPINFMVGTGIGSSFPDGRERNYSEFQYIELQSLYLLVQLGQIGMLIYLATLAFSAHRFLNRDGRRVFWLYVFSGCTNPTILDANQIVATLLLICIFPKSPIASTRLAGGSLAQRLAQRVAPLSLR
jgi:hypothetical protein